MTTSCPKAVVGGRHEHAPSEILLLQKISLMSGIAKGVIKGFVEWCNLALCWRAEQFMVCLSGESCLKSIMLKEKSYMCVCFVDLEKAFHLVPW